MKSYHLITEQQHFNMCEALELLNLIQGLAYEAEDSSLAIKTAEVAALASVISGHFAPLLNAPCQQVELTTKLK